MITRGEFSFRGILFSTITLQAIAEFFTAESLARCDFIKVFIISHSNLLAKSEGSDLINDAKTFFQTASFSEWDNMESLYISSTSSISDALTNEGIKNQIKSHFLTNMEERINKNNLYIELVFQEISAANEEQKSVIMLQPNINGIGIDLAALWNQFIKT